MSPVLVSWLILNVAVIAFLVGVHRGRRHGRLEMAALIEARYGPLLEQLEQLAESTEHLGAELSGETQERIEAMREASWFN